MELNLKLVSFEVAKLAKEKGFHHMKPNCFGDNMCYNLDDPTAIPACRGNVVIGYILAPTQELLKKWLREVHKMYVEAPLAIYTSQKFGWHVIYKRGAEVISRGLQSYPYDTYEEALEEALKQALLLVNNR